MKKIIKIIYKKVYKKMNLLEDLKMSPLNFNFAMVYIIHKILVLLKNHLKIIFLRSVIGFYFFKTKFFFFIIYNDEKSKA